MDQLNKATYESPQMEVVELKSEGLICASGDYNGFGDEREW